MIDESIETILKRSRSIFEQDVEAHSAELVERISGARILVLGASGSVGSAFVKKLSAYKPGCLHLVDLSENNLVELVRDLRASNLKPVEDFKTFAIDFDSVEFYKLLGDQEPYDYIANFAALKHVRSERDPYTLMRMINTNVLTLDRLLSSLKGDPQTRVFSVSSDKAVRPASMMGATKALMEEVLWLHSEINQTTCARFANVAFSDGSLLMSFINRFEKSQALSGPSDISRYFMSPGEAGEFCLLSVFLGGNREIFVPRLNEDNDLVSFLEVAEHFLAARGFKPRHCDSEAEAKEFARELDRNSTEWPCFFEPSDTSGEKSYEEFVATGENVNYGAFEKIGVINKMITTEDATQAAIILEELRKVQNSGKWMKHDLVELVKTVVREFDHVERDRDLDQKI